MPSRRCEDCDLDYPPNFALPNGTQSTDYCHVCGKNTVYSTSRSAPWDWDARVHKVKQERERRQKEAEEYPIPRAEGELGIYGESGQFFVDDWDLRKAKLFPPSDRRMFLFRVEDQVWEAQGWQESKRRWWVCPVEETISDSESLTDAISV